MRINGDVPPLLSSRVPAMPRPAPRKKKNPLTPKPREPIIGHKKPKVFPGVAGSKLNLFA